ncbi:MAG TPA: stalk domain-containing protein, partial [Pyrinomonadaceae bacterium]|nr:stalk domain-containing protein [Pyrinomonadaceae bacterium]
MDNSSSIRTAIAAVCLICLLATTSHARLAARAAALPSHAIAPRQPKSETTPTPPQRQATAIIVDERMLTGSQSFAQQRGGGRIFLPVASIARALGDVINVDAAKRTVEVRRQTGVVAKFDAGLNQVSENNSLILSVSNAADISFPPNADELMLPIEIVSALLDASIRLDEAAHAIRITRARAQGASTVRTGAGRAPFELYGLGYDYNLNSYSASSYQSLTLRADGRIGDGRFSLLTNSSTGGAGASFGLLRNGSFTYERPNEQRFTGGDFGTGTDLLFMSSTVRGASAQLPVGGARLTLFAGRAISGVSQLQPPESSLLPDDLQQPDSVQPHKIRYDTNVFGAAATFNAPGGAASSRPGQTLFSVGMIRFDGAGRSGEMFTTSARYASARGRFQGDVGAGRFSGARPDGSRADGGALAADLSASYDLSNRLTIQGRYAHVGANFLGTQAGLHEPVRAASGGATWRPADWLAASFTGSFATRTQTGSLPRQRERFLTTTLNLTPRGAWPTVFFSHTASRATKASGAYTLFNASKDFSGGRLFLNATRIKSFGAAFLSAQVGANVRVGEAGALGLSQSFGSRGALGGAVDWNGQSFLVKRVSFGAGLNYQRMAGAHVNTAGRVFSTVRLPRESTVQFTYLQGQTGAQILFSLRGTLLRTRKSESSINAPVAELDSYGAFYGRVYQDMNLDGQFEPGLDKPQANVKIRVDGNRYVVSDESGRYRVDNIRAGEHAITLDLLSVRADLTLLDGAQQAASLLPGRDSIVDFRLVRTGRITGLVWLDLNGNNQLDAGEQPLAGVRIVTGSSRDTLTDDNGVFVIGDLPPGEHVVLIDEKTLPEKTVSAKGTLTAKVVAGSETGNLNFPVTPA